MTRKTPTTLGYALLGLIRIEVQTGYSLRKVFETTPMGHYSSSPGAIYPALKRLEEQGLIEGRVEDRDTLRPKRVYRMTPLGDETLLTWVSRPLTKDDLVWRDDEVMLRFAFMGTVADDRTTHRFLEEMLDALDLYIPELERVLAATPREGPPHGRLALGSGIEAFKARRRWAKRTIKEFAPSARKEKKP
jgi:DNA-binding PadR family transcriptional regulator